MHNEGLIKRLARGVAAGEAGTMAMEGLLMATRSDADHRHTEQSDQRLDPTDGHWRPEDLV